MQGFGHIGPAFIENIIYLSGFHELNPTYFDIKLNIHHYCKSSTTEIKIISSNIVVTYIKYIFNMWGIEGVLSVL